MQSGITTLQTIRRAGFHTSLEQQTARLCAGLEQAAQDAGIAFTTNHVCGMFGLFFTAADTVTSFADVMQCDADRFKRFFHLMLAAGVNLAPSPFEAGFISSAHGESEIDATVDAAAQAFRVLSKE